MSIGNNHVLSKLDKSSKAMDGQRLCRVIAKKNKEGEYESSHLSESKCVSLPVINPEFNQVQMTMLAPHIVGLLQDAQDSLIRDLIIEKGISSVNDEEISFEKCIAYMDEDKKGNRVTGEYMGKWFSEVYGEPALEFIAVQICRFALDTITPDQSAVIEKRSNVLASMFIGFASGKYSPDIPKCKAVLKFGEFLGEGNWDTRMKMIQEKTGKMLREKEEALSMDALGF